MENALQLDLFGCERALVIAVLDEWRAGLDPLAFREEDRVTRLWVLSRALILMQLEPVLLEAPLGAVLGWIIQALRARVVRNELLVEFFTVLVVGAKPVLLLFPNMLQRTLIVAALADVDQFVAWWFRRSDWLFFR